MEKEQITAIFPDASEEQAASLLSAVEEELKPLTAATTELEAANKRVGELSDALKRYSGTDEQIKGLQDKVKEYEQADLRRKQAEEQAVKDKNLLTAFEAAAQGKTFVNDYTKNALFEQVKSELSKQENAGKGVADIFCALTADKTDIFAPEISLPNMGASVVTQQDATADLRKIMGL